MLVYLLLFVIFALGAMRSEGRPIAMRAPDAPVASAKRVEVHAHDLLLVSACLLTIAAIGFRYEVGADWEAYELIYDLIGRFSLGTSLSTWEQGFVLSNALAHWLGAGIWLVNLICAGIFIYGLLQFARGQPNPWLAMLVAVPYLIVVVGMGYTRQAVAIGCCMAGLAAASRGSLPKLIIWILVGALFHRTAVVILPLVLFSYARNMLQLVLLAVGAAVIGYYVLGAGVSSLERLYVNRLYVAQGALIRLLMNVPPALVFLAFANRFNVTIQERSIWRNFSLAAVASMVAWFFLESNVALDRLALYLIPLQIFVLSRLPNLMSGGSTQSGGAKAVIIFYSLAVLLLWLNFAVHAQAWIPYSFYPIR